jgi:hypothetical protein
VSQVSTAPPIALAFDIVGAILLGMSAHQDAFQKQMAFYIADAIGTRAQFEAAWRNLFLNVTTRDGDKLCMLDETGTQLEDLNDALIAPHIQGK